MEEKRRKTIYSISTLFVQVFIFIYFVVVLFYHIYVTCVCDRTLNTGEQIIIFWV